MGSFAMLELAYLLYFFTSWDVWVRYLGCRCSSVPLLFHLSPLFFLLVPYSYCWKFAWRPLSPEPHEDFLSCWKVLGNLIRYFDFGYIHSFSYIICFLSSVKSIRTCQPQPSSGGSSSGSRAAKADGVYYYSSKVKLQQSLNSILWEACFTINNDSEWEHNLSDILVIFIGFAVFK